DGAGLRLARVGGTPGRLLGLVRLHTLLPVYDTVEQALAAVRPARPLSPSFPRWRS
ncbi:MAG: hypothetical protein HOY71_46800, partial [Nonomuraea sp.]|nr:hypothetical protein [Nonomuraea sp.]